MKMFDIHLNGEVRRVPEGTKIADLLAVLGKTSRAVAVERNESLVPRAVHAQCVLEPDDRVEIVTLVGGG